LIFFPFYRRSSQNMTPPFRFASRLALPALPLFLYLSFSAPLTLFSPFLVAAPQKDLPFSHDSPWPCLDFGYVAVVRRFCFAFLSLPWTCYFSLPIATLSDFFFPCAQRHLVIEAFFALVFPPLTPVFFSLAWVFFFSPLYGKRDAWLCRRSKLAVRFTIERGWPFYVEPQFLVLIFLFLGLRGCSFFFFIRFSHIFPYDEIPPCIFQLLVLLFPCPPTISSLFHFSLVVFLSLIGVCVGQSFSPLTPFPPLVPHFFGNFSPSPGFLFFVFKIVDHRPFFPSLKKARFSSISTSFFSLSLSTED